MPIIIWGLVYAVVTLVLAVVAYLLTPSPKQPGQADKQVEIPGVEEGKTIGICYGTNEISDPTVIAYWGRRIVTEHKEVSSKK